MTFLCAYSCFEYHKDDTYVTATIKKNESKTGCCLFPHNTAYSLSVAKRAVWRIRKRMNNLDTKNEISSNEHMKMIYNHDTKNAMTET